MSAPSFGVAGIHHIDRRTGVPMSRPDSPPPRFRSPSRALIEGAIAYARDVKLSMAVAVVDAAGNVVSADRMDGAALQNIRFAEGKAFAAALYRQTTDDPAGALQDAARPLLRHHEHVSGQGLPGRRRTAARARRSARRRRRRRGLPEGIDEKSAHAGIDGLDEAPRDDETVVRWISANSTAPSWMSVTNCQAVE